MRMKIDYDKDTRKVQEMYVDMIIHGVAQYLCGIQMIKNHDPNYEVDMKHLNKVLKKSSKDRVLPMDITKEVFDTILKIAKEL